MYSNNIIVIECQQFMYYLLYIFLIHHFKKDLFNSHWMNKNHDKGELKLSFLCFNSNIQTSSIVYGIGGGRLMRTPPPLFGYMSDVLVSVFTSIESFQFFFWKVHWGDHNSYTLDIRHLKWWTKKIKTNKN